MTCDVTSKPSLANAVSTIQESTAHINLLVANSGIVGSATNAQPKWSVGEIRERLWGAEFQDWAGAWETNVSGVHFSIVAFLELLAKGNELALSGDGYGALEAGRKGDKNVGRGLVPRIQSQVVTLSSVSAYSRNSASPMAYGASKVAVTHLTKVWSSLLAEKGIRVNAVAPGSEYPFSFSFCGCGYLGCCVVLMDTSLPE